ncbi:MAG: hypothetical protein MUF24_06255 [Chitinophagaceae bacterium]|jgi:hypothetical protein|nr:hypothetical protein [Chitinophagaceae bacterium]
MANRILKMQQRLRGKHVVLLTRLAHKPELLWWLNLSDNYPLETDRLLQQ